MRQEPFFWVIPLQIIDWLHLIPVQRRMKRIVYPYLITIIQVSVFVYYMVKLNSHVADVVFTNIGLIIYSLVMVLFTKGLLTWLAKYVRKMQKNEQLVTIERQ
ncbi:hypothetical protein [Evansella halocellulosilytica]|uniref:hypothetical protein n=1 Tax=Evansella halocellulosilytica TaxID=2011013 RepID=UPI0011556B96|nr:hypothetical protein [Evansella halocellulosilytica]